MSNQPSQLPPGFEALEPFAGAWSIAGAANRARRRLESTEAERTAFYGVLKEMLPAALEYLDRKPLANLDARETRLMNFALSFAHIALAIELQADDEAKHAKARKYLTITRASADE